MFNATIVMTLGAPGCGKSYSRCARFLVDYWLKDKKGIHYSNFPVNRERVAAAVAKKDSGPEFDALMDRIQVIPEAVLKTWMRGESGPWEYFANKDLDGAHIAIDECHQYIRRQGGRGYIDVIKKWEDWLSTIRHKACTVEFLTQDPHKVAKCIEIHSSVRLQLINSEDRRDPWFGVLLGDWYELRAGFVTREYETVIWEVEERRLLGKWKTQETRRFRLDPYYFQFYDSFNAASHDGSKAATAPEREFQKRSRLGLLWWFAQRSWVRMALRMIILSVVFWLMTGGGGSVAGWYSSWSSAIAAKNGVSFPKGKSEILAPRMTQLVPAESHETVPTPARIGPKAPAVIPTARAEILTVPGPTQSSTPVRLNSLDLHSVSADQKAEKAAAVPTVRRVVLVARDGAVLSDGTRLKPGCSIGHDDVAAMDWEERSVVMTSGKRVKVGGVFDEEK